MSVPYLIYKCIMNFICLPALVGEELLIQAIVHDVHHEQRQRLINLEDPSIELLENPNNGQQWENVRVEEVALNEWIQKNRSNKEVLVGFGPSLLDAVEN